jgi:hypothetical protein
MSVSQLLSIAILVGMMVLFLWGRFRYGLTAIIALLVAAADVSHCLHQLACDVRFGAMVFSRPLTNRSPKFIILIVAVYHGNFRVLPNLPGRSARQPSLAFAAADAHRQI